MMLHFNHRSGLGKNEVIYHLFQRSFFDANGDAHGDLKGILEKLDYLQQLGVTTLLLTPLYQSAYYHNYFADNFELIDAAYGSFDDYFNLVRALKQRGMKLIMDMEIQYVAEGHEWFRDSLGNPGSRFSEYIVYKDKEQNQPESILFNINGQLGYDGVYKNITTVNLLSKKVQDYLLKLFVFWMDPHGDGSMREGVDGFRLDHMMDVLDDKSCLSNLFKTFWKPLLRKLKKVNPAIFLVAEQTNWDSFGNDYPERAGVDSIFAFPLREAFISFDKQKIEYAASVSFQAQTTIHNPIVFIENHDTYRFATLVGSHPGKLRMGAAFSLLFPGVPSLYYGQEIGMEGAGGFGTYGNSDGNDIPRREAFKWFRKVNEPGMALWYKDTGPWWNDTTLKDDNGRSLEEQVDDPTSLWHYYQRLIGLRKKYKALSVGAYIPVSQLNGSVVCFIRFEKPQILLAALNLSEYSQELVIPNGNELLDRVRRTDCLTGDTLLTIRATEKKASLGPFAVVLWACS